MAKLLLIAFVLADLAIEAQSISITTPAPNDAVSGYTGYYFQVSLSSAPSVVRVCYTVDAYPAYNPGIDASTTLGCSNAQPYSYPYNSYWNLNGPHQVVATAYDSLGNVVATSAVVPFTTANNWPVSYVPGMTVATGTPVTSNWSGSVNVTPTISGSSGANMLVYNFYVDGIFQGTSGGQTTTSYTFAVDTTQFLNNPHNVCVEVTDNTAGTNYTGFYIGAATEWCQTVNFQNGAVASQALTSAHDIYLAPGATYTLTASVLNTDGSTSASSPVFTSLNPSVATVGQSTGLITAVANGNAIVNAMTPTFSATNLVVNGSVNVSVYTASGPAFSPTMNGWLLQITGGAGWTPGVYAILSVGNNGQAILNSSPAPTGTTGGQFSTGPTRQDWVFVWPTNTLPHFGSDGSILTSYEPANSFVVHSIFSSIGLLSGEQPYNPGAAADLNASAINTFELGIIPNAITGAETSASAWQGNLNAYIASNEAALFGYPKFHLMLTGDNLTKADSSLWGSTRGNPSTWSPPAFQYAIQQWTAQGNVLGVPMQDEVNSAWAGAPLQGPISYSNSGTQSWLVSITASSGTCTAVTSFSYSINATNRFVISGSEVPNMNSTAGTEYTATRTGANFTFPCAGVSDDTYNSSNDPGLILEPYADNWYASNTDYIHYDAFGQLRAQANNVTGRFGMSWPNAGNTTCSSVAGWGGNSTQSIGSIAQVADYSDMYWPHGSGEQYMVSRLAANSLLQSGDIGYNVRQMYGCYNPSLPITVLTQGTNGGMGNGGYGVGQGPQVGVASTSGTLVTFTGPHGITDVIPGITRLFITGATDTGGPADSTNNNFMVWNCPTATTCNVTLAATDFTASTPTFTNGGTVTFQDANTLPLQGITANGIANSCYGSGVGGNWICGDEMRVVTASAANFRERGETFTLSGVTGDGAANFNSGTFLFLPENLNTATAPNTNLFYRQLPSLSATGGTATIIHDNNYVKGRNGSVEMYDTNPGWSFGTVVECMIVRCAGERIYKGGQYVSGYSDQMGFTAQFAELLNPTFSDNTLTSGGQLFMNEHFENAATVPLFHAINSGALIFTRLQKYILQPTLNSPDYGSLTDCSARSGSYGDLLFCLNASDGPQSITFTLTPYLQSGQQIIRYIVNDHSIRLTTLSAGTATDTPTLQPLDAVFYVFPAVFAGELQQPSISASLSDVPNAAKIVVRYSYDRYYLDAAINNVFDCGTGACTPAWDPSIGTVFYRLIYLDANSQVLATSDIQTEALSPPSFDIIALSAIQKSAGVRMPRAARR